MITKITNSISKWNLHPKTNRNHLRNLSKLQISIGEKEVAKKSSDIKPFQTLLNQMNFQGAKYMNMFPKIQTKIIKYHQKNQ
jgi:hypothetical protein